MAVQKIKSRLLRSVIDNESRVDAVLGLADLVSAMSSFLSLKERYHVAEYLRSIADHAERDVLDEVPTC